MTVIPSDPHVFEIHPAITHKGVVWESITLREPTIGEIGKTEDLTGSASMVKLVSLVSGAPVEVISAIGVKTFLKMAERMSFLGKVDSQETGAE